MSAPSPFSEDRLMSISASEFEASIALLGAHAQDANLTKIFDVGSGTVRITFEQVESVRLGGLLALPRARVTLVFSENVPAKDRAAFIRRFDIAFQRGGG